MTGSLPDSGKPYPPPFKIREAHTTYRNRDLEKISPGEAKGRLWMDSVYFYRDASILTKTNDGFQQFLFHLTLNAWSHLPFDFIHVTQASNLQWIMESIAPTHFVPLDGTSSPTSYNDILSAGAEAMENCWIWHQDFDSRTSLPFGAIPITTDQVKAYFKLNVLDVSTYFPLRPNAIFVRKFRGKFDQLFFFSNHPCTLDQSRYPHNTYTVSCAQYHSIYFTLLDLYPPTSNSTLQIKEFLKATAPESTSRTYLHSLYDLGDKDQAFLVTNRNGSTLDAIRQLRVPELTSRTGRKFSDLSRATQELVAKHLLVDPSDTSIFDTPDYKFVCQVEPQSLIADLIVNIISKTLVGQALREQRFEDDKLKSDLDRKIYEEARESLSWTKKLQDSYYLTEIEVHSSHRFRLAAAVYQDTKTVRWVDYSRLNRRKLYLARSRPLRASALEDGSIWWWSSHAARSAVSAEERLLYGFRQAPETNGRHRIVWDNSSFRPQDQCSSCSKKGHLCFIPYSEALRQGFILEELEKPIFLSGLQVLIVHLESAFKEVGTAVDQEVEEVIEILREIVGGLGVEASLDEELEIE